MLASKRKLKLKVSKARKTLERRRLHVRRKSHFWRLYRRFLLSRVSVLIDVAATKRRTRRFFRLSDRRRQRRDIIVRKIVRLSRKLRRNKRPRVARRVETSLTPALRRPLNLARGKALFAVCRRVRARIYTHQGYSTRSKIVAFRQYHRALRRVRTARGRRSRRSRVLRRSLHLLRPALQFSRSQLLIPTVHLKRLRRRAVLFANRSLKKGKSRVMRARPWARRRRILAAYRRRRLRALKKYGRRRVRAWRLRRKRNKKHSKKRVLRVRPRIRRRRVFRVVGKGVKLRVLLRRLSRPNKRRRSLHRLFSRRYGKLRLWLFLKRANKRARIRARHARRSWQKRVQKVLRRHPRRKPIRRHLKQKKMRRRVKARSGMLHKRRRYAARTRAKRRLRPRKRHPRIWFRPITRRVGRRLIRRFFRRRAARSRAWLRAVSFKARSNSLRSSLSACGLRSTTQIIVTKAPRVTDRCARLLFLRSALRSRIKVYRSKRRALRSRVSRSGARHRLRRRRGRRYLLCFKRSKDFYPERRDSRRIRRERRKYYGLIRRRGRAWGRWLRLPRRYFSPYLRAIRKNFASKPRLFNRGSWAFFYRDREFTPTYERQPKSRPVRKLRGVRYPQLRRCVSLRVRSKNRPMWYTSKYRANRLWGTIIKKNKAISRALRRRAQTRRYGLHGAAFAFKDCASPQFGLLPYQRKNVSRRRVGRRIFRWIPRRRSRLLPARTRPLVASFHPVRNRRLSVAKVFVGARLPNLASPNFVRKMRRNFHPANLKYALYCYSAELQQNLRVNLPTRTQKKRKFVKKARKLRVRQKGKPSRRRIPARVRLARFWFRQLRHRLISTRRHVFRILQKRRRRKPHAWRSLLTLLDLEVEVEPALDTALEFLDSTDVQINPEPETETQGDETP